MNLSFLLDIQEKSKSISHTPSQQARKLPFYVQDCGHFYANSSYFTERDGLDNYLLIYTVSGSGYLKYKNSEFNIGPGQIALFCCLEPHYYKTGAESSWEFKWLHLSGTVIKEYCDMINSDSLNIVTMSDSSHISNILDNIYHLVEIRDILLDVKICSLLTNLLTEVITSRHSPLNNKKFTQHKEEVDKVLSFIHENYYKKISTEDITNLVLISKYHFSRLFKSYTGLSPYEYLINYRVNVSKSLLQYTDKTLVDISSCVGFNDTSNFIRYFKRLVGTTPASYRKAWSR